jgi:hypothetical protein
MIDKNGKEITNYDIQKEEWERCINKKEPCEDAVSRSQALEELEESAKHHANDSREEVLLRRDRDIIRALPPVKPEEVKAIPLEKLKNFRNKVMNMNSIAIIQRLDKLIEEVEE